MRLELFSEPANLSLYWSEEAKRPALTPTRHRPPSHRASSCQFDAGSISPYTFTLANNMRPHCPHSELIPFLQAPPAAGNMLSSTFSSPPLLLLALINRLRTSSSTPSLPCTSCLHTSPSTPDQMFYKKKKSRVHLEKSPDKAFVKGRMTWMVSITFKRTNRVCYCESSQHKASYWCKGETLATCHSLVASFCALQCFL